MIQGILFDMDGVLFDTEQLYVRVEKKLMAEMGFPQPDSFHLSLCGVSGAAAKKLFHDACGPDFDLPHYSAEVHHRLRNLIAEEGLPKKPQLEETLAWLQKKGYKMAVASSSQSATIRSHLAEGGVSQYFSAIVGRDMVKKEKPAPDSYLAAAAALGFAPQNCLAVEDSAAGARAALAAGCVTVIIPDLIAPPADLAASVYAVLPALTAIPPLLEKLPNTPCG